MRYILGAILIVAAIVAAFWLGWWIGIIISLISFYAYKHKFVTPEIYKPLFIFS